ncbi:aminotransferase class III-fold pyridoxal phosphate-dependent enzyme [Roseateles sp.]|jgi:acetylornithine/N-succinyldiaminopimelate aminotransferase|uniref:aminotransferase class III-fold pyridoxal phosphate-dependent enzyme n=1 Tax=Roseateles sp. TaxID=1971397 RepID=UPI0037CC8AB8
MNALSKTELQSLMPITQRPAQLFVRGQGDWLWDEADHHYLDWVQGWAVNALGHCAPEIVAALQRQSTRLLHGGPGLHNDQAPALARALTDASGLAQVFFTNSGADANEGMIKLARKYGQQHKGGAHKIITFSHSFHGRTLATMSASGKPGFAALFPPAVPGFAQARYNDLASTEALIDEQTVAIMLELVQGEAGVIPATPEFVLGLRALCEQHGLLLLIDEVQTGMGRCGTLFAHQHYGLQPDLMSLGKGLGGGVPIGATLASAAVSACLAPGDLGGTYNGNALVCAVGQAVLATVSQPDFLAHVRHQAAWLAAELVALSRRRSLGALRHCGLLLALDLPATLTAERVVGAARDAAFIPGGTGLLINGPRPHTLRLMPALNSRRENLLQGLALLEAAIEAAR